MCVIVDTNCLASVFDTNSAKHNEFRPVLEWVLSGKGKLVYGGTKYIQELSKTKYLKLFNILNAKTKKVVIVDKGKVDQEQSRIEHLIIDPDFDDPHLPAIVIVSKCEVICSEDTRSVRFVTDNKLYPKGINIPKYYTSIRNKNLLCDDYVNKIYKPLGKCAKKDIELINLF